MFHKGVAVFKTITLRTENHLDCCGPENRRRLGDEFQKIDDSLPSNVTAKTFYSKSSVPGWRTDFYNHRCAHLMTPYRDATPMSGFHGFLMVHRELFSHDE